ncbi:MAG: hypothetical protein ACXVLQ_12550 [Bacteriovorax sp.]
MLKRMTALFLLTAFTQVYAVTPVLNYKLNIEWDQKNSASFNKTNGEYEKEIADLEANDLSSEELAKHATSNTNGTIDVFDDTVGLLSSPGQFTVF